MTQKRSARPKRLRVFGQRPSKGRRKPAASGATKSGEQARTSPASLPKIIRAAGASQDRPRSRPTSGPGKSRPKTSAASGPGKNRSKAKPARAQGRGRVQVQPEAPAGSLWSGILERSRQENATGDGLIRLNAWLARCGIASRRASDEMIASGRVQVDGKVTRELGQKVDPLRQVVLVDGQPLRPEKPTYVLLNKPRGVVCTNSNREQKPRAIDLVAGVKGRLFAIGRLDLDSEGLLLLTNDGAFADRLTHPRFGVSKTYDAILRGRVETGDLDKARGGVWLSEGKTEGFRIRIKRRTADRSYLEVTIREGKNREIRRVFARLGHPVLRLRRVRIGPLSIRGVGNGRWRFLRADEVEALWNQAGA